ncbi:hypothetical protein HJ170_18245 [Vibrio parahaemolyticus]|nr:hypothetical protein [Vibrio parahaemolyticus]
MSDYPDYYPDDMPPKDAIAASGTAFRLVNSNPPVKTCFSSTLEENPGRKAKKPTDREMLYGSSLFTQKKRSAQKEEFVQTSSTKAIVNGRTY